MKEQQIEKDLSSIRQLMERSSKFISLSGLSGILAGIYALIGSVIAYRLIFGDYRFFEYRDYIINYEVVRPLLAIAFAVLGASIANAVWLSYRKSRARGQLLFGPATRLLVMNLIIPLVAGGLFKGWKFQHGCPVMSHFLWLVISCRQQLYLW
jgi:hypothetical protein